MHDSYSLNVGGNCKCSGCLLPACGGGYGSYVPVADGAVIVDTRHGFHGRRKTQLRVACAIGGNRTRRQDPVFDDQVVVVDDMIAVRPMCYMTLGYDHRLIDGADAGRFLLALKERLQNFDESWL